MVTLIHSNDDKQCIYQKFNYFVKKNAILSKEKSTKKTEFYKLASAQPRMAAPTYVASSATRLTLVFFILTAVIQPENIPTSFTRPLSFLRESKKK